MPGCTNRSATSRPSSTSSTTATGSSPPRSARPPGLLIEAATPEKKEQLRSPSRAQDPTETVPVKPGPAQPDQGVGGARAGGSGGEEEREDGGRRRGGEWWT